ncbi:hypothetical protein [Sphaerimonospora thailandensis]|nr:hypothetical protein [Sphaerimonospora thailandensis]
MGLGLLAKRLLQYQLRAPSTLANTMAYTYKQWNEAIAMQAWIRRYGSLKGFSDWTRSPRIFPGIAPGAPMTPGQIMAGALEVVLDAITGTAAE